MKRLVIGRSPLIDPPFRVMVDEALGGIQRGEEVVYAACHGACRTCFANPGSGVVQCLCCKMFAWLYERAICKQGKVVSFPHVKAVQNKLGYKTNQELKLIVYKGVNVGYAVFSEYVTWTRDVAGEISTDKKRFLDYLLVEACKHVDAAEMLINTVKPDVISVFNGRLIETRPFLELAKQKGVHVHVCEVVYKKLDNGKYLYLKDDCENNLPHNIDVFTGKIEKCWAESALSDGEKEKIADEFFLKRVKGVPSGEGFKPGLTNVFVGKQSAGQLPNGFDSKKKNIIIFNSSEDELSSVDPEFESHALYGSQIDGIKAVVEALKDNPKYHVYLRVHPNLSRINYAYHTDIYKLPELYNNLTVIPATSPCSTYTLMNSADKVVVMGSTMGVEATYWGKPVILLNSSWYYNLDVAYKPKNYEELKSLLLTDELKPKSKDDARRYAFFLVRRIDMALTSYVIDFGCYTTKIFGKSYVIPNWPRFFHSDFLTAFLRTSRFRNARFLARNPLPVEYYKLKS